MKNYNSILKVCLVMFLSTLFVSCDNDDNDDNIIEVVAPWMNPPHNYDLLQLHVL